jgi:hypothetical protein
VTAARLRAAFSKPLLPVVFFLAGVTYDGVTLTRIDSLLDNLILFLYLSLLGGLIVLTARADLGRTTIDATVVPGHVKSLIARAQPHYPHAIQFLLGGLFSAYTIFYSQSASLTATAVFFGLLVALLVGNELLHDRLSNLRLLFSLYALVVFSFFTFFLPVLTGWMNTWVFLFGACLSAAVTVGVMRLVYRGTADGLQREALWTGLPALGLIGLLVGFYFLNWIPPVPLSMKFGGVYHNITKADGTYHLMFEQGAWYQFWKRSDDPFRGADPAYCFTAVFAPVDLHTTIYHRWQYRPPGRHGFSMTDRIGFTISGGREGGYRGYTIKQHVLPGDWRVDAETAEGRVIGRVSFRVVEPGGAPLELDSITY